jgi:hypothetical protein
MQDGMRKTCGAAVETAGHRVWLENCMRGDNVQDNVDGRVELIEVIEK